MSLTIQSRFRFLTRLALVSSLGIAPACGTSDGDTPGLDTDDTDATGDGGASSGANTGAGGSYSGGGSSSGGRPNDGSGAAAASGGAIGNSGGADMNGSGGMIVVPDAVACDVVTETTDATDINVDGNDVATDNVNGLTFKGFGVLSANGTSELLMDYKAQHPEAYLQLLQILFGGSRPIITHLKLEMGNDRNNSTGPDKATMRSANEAANVARTQGFQLVADAKKINPEIKVSVLRWNAPGWANTNDKVYTWFKTTILAAYRSYGYMVDYVNPGLNERTPDLNWTKDYASRVQADSTGFNDQTEQELYNSIKTVISDEAGLGSFGGAMLGDAQLRNAVAVAGYHYNTDDDGGGSFKKLAEEFDIEVWNSEAQATFSNSAFRPNNNMRDPKVVGTGIGGLNGPLEMGNTIIKGFVNSRRTHVVYQPAIGSFYEGGQYSFKELLSARDPWSGWVHYDVGLLILRHFSWFSKTGWENDENSAGIWRVLPQASRTTASGTNPVSGRNGQPNYMTLAAPDRGDFSTVLMNDSEQVKTYRIQVSNIAHAEDNTLELWETRAADQGRAFNEKYLKYLCDMKAEGGAYTIKVQPYSVLTATTLRNREQDEFNQELPVEGARDVLDTEATGTKQDTSDDILYADDFDYSDQDVAIISPTGTLDGTENYVSSRGGPASVMARYTSDRNGAFEAFLPSGSSDYVLRQQVDETSMGLGGTWNAGNPITAIGDNRWLNYKASVDVSFESSATGSNNYAAIGIHQQGGTNSHDVTGTPYLLKLWHDGGWQLAVDGKSTASGNVVSGTGPKVAGFLAGVNQWHKIALLAVNNKITAYIEGTEVATFTDPKSRLSGRVDLASGYVFTRFDNLKVEKVAGAAPYYSELLDNLEMNDLASPPSPKLVYEGNWGHENGKSMFNYQRSLSTSQGTGSILKYNFNGTGIDILGVNDGSAKLEITVDGQVIENSAQTTASSELYQTFSLRGLTAQEHDLQVRVVTGTLVVDAVGVVP